MAALALLAWPIIAVFLFKSKGASRGLLWSILLGFLFLPEGYTFNLPGLPPISKTEILVISAILGLLATRSERRQPKPASVSPAVTFMVGFLIFGLLGSLVVTMLNNRAPMVFLESRLPGMSFSDYRAMAMDSMILVIPLLLARRYLARPEMHKEILQALVMLGFVYSGLMLIEIRFSPQLHTWIYGYFQHSFSQHIRGGNFRPIVFLPHGLSVGMFMLTTVIAAFTLSRSAIDAKLKQKYFLAGCWLFLMLLLSRNFGATAIAAMFVPLVFFAPRRVQVWAATAAVTIFLVFPAMRQSGIFPMDGILDVVSSISYDRALSFQFRTDNEDLFLARAAEKSMFGWGNWGRWRIYDEFGRDLAVVDGRWIGHLGERGWIGYLTFFGFLAMPILLLNGKHARKSAQPETVSLAVIVGCNLLYMIPNDPLSPLMMMYAGTTIGFYQLANKSGTKTNDPTPAPPSSRSQYTRFERS